MRSLCPCGGGCENSSIGELKKLLGDWDPERTAFLECQSVPDELEAGRVLLRLLIDHAAKDVRCSIPASELVIGLKCGGSDGLSDITANPLVGHIADRPVSMGGSALLAEVPEMFGAEGVLFRRCADETVQRELPALVADFKEYFVRHGQVVHENPSPGNKAGGITTLEEKSLGCIHKGGHSPINAVYDYAKQVESKQGLVIMDTPGNDPASVAAMVAGGAQVIVFSSGRGSPVGHPIAPVVKVTGNKITFANMEDNIDFCAAPLIYGEKTVEQLGTDLLNMVVETACGKQTKAEALGFVETAIARICNYV